VLGGLHAKPIQRRRGGVRVPAGPRLEVLEKAPEPGTFRGENAVERLDFQSDAQILTYVHELFHEYQTKVWPFKAEQVKKEAKYREMLARAKSAPPKTKRLYRSDMPPIPSIPLAFAVYKDIEGRALMSAFGAKDSREAIERSFGKRTRPWPKARPSMPRSKWPN